MFTLFMTTKLKIYTSEFRTILWGFFRLLSQSFMVTDGYPAQHRPSMGEKPPLISYGVISSRLPSLIRLGTVTLQATTTKHARQVWLSLLPQIDIKLSRSASAIKRARTVSSPVKGYRRPSQLCPQPMCDRCFKEFFDSLTSPLLPLLLHLLPPLPPPRCFPFSALLIKRGDPGGKLWFPSPHCYCSEVSAACPHTRPVKPSGCRRLGNEWS